jgi:hypothetical protein
MAKAQTWVGFCGTSWGRIRNTTAQRKPKNQSRAQCTQTSNTTRLQRRQWELITACFACLKANEKAILTCIYLNLMCLSSLTTPPAICLSKISILYPSLASDPMQTSFLSLPCHDIIFLKAIYKDPDTNSAASLKVPFQWSLLSYTLPFLELSPSYSLGF